MLSQALEAAMLLCFGLSWPTNAYKNYQARTAAGTSWQFIMLITVGYFAGIAAKLCSGQINWVLAIYFLNLVFLTASSIRNISPSRCSTTTSTSALRNATP